MWVLCAGLVVTRDTLGMVVRDSPSLKSSPYLCLSHCAALGVSPSLAETQCSPNPQTLLTHLQNWVPSIT